MALMHAGDDRGAAAAFAEGRAEGDPSAALMEGISRYRLHDDGEAAAALRVAERDPDSAPSARFFLGLVALRDGRGADAAALLEAAGATDPQLAPLASSLARVAHREGRLVISAQAESAWDSNVTLAPSGAPAAGRASDGMGGLAAAIRVAPLGESGPYAVVGGTHREQLRLDPYDLWGLGAAAGWKLGRDARYAAVEYGFDHVVLGGSPYLDAHRITASGRLDVAPRSSLGLTYLARFEDYRPAVYTDYSGLRHFAEGDATVGLGRGWVVTAAYHLGCDGARDASLSWWEHGPRAAVQEHLGPSLRLGLEAAGTWRDYDRVDPVLLVRRSDTYADVAAWLDGVLEERLRGAGETASELLAGGSVTPARLRRILAGAGEIREEHLVPASARPGRSRAADVLGGGFNLDGFERELIHAALARAGGNKTLAAHLLGITRRRLYSRLESLEARVEGEPQEPPVLEGRPR